MDPKTLDLVPDHVPDIMSQEQEFNNPSYSWRNRFFPIAVHDTHSSLNVKAVTTLRWVPDHVLIIWRESCNSIQWVLDNVLNIRSQVRSAISIGPFYADTPVESSTWNRKACKSLLSGRKNEYSELCVPLYQAAIKGDWKAAKFILERRPELVRFAITAKGDTALHIAARARATKQGEVFVKNLVEMMELEDLEIENDGGDWAYMMAAAKGNVYTFDVMVNKHKDLLSKVPKKTLVALNTSAIYGNHDMTLHFYNVLEKKHLGFWGEAELCLLFINCLHGDLFDIALKVLEDHHSVIGASINTCLVSLDILARRPDTLNRTETLIQRITDSILAFFHVKKNSPEMDNPALKLVQSLLKLYRLSSDRYGMLDHLNMSISEEGLQDMGTYHRALLFTAAEMGNTRFVIELNKMFPHIVNETKDGGISILNIAIMRRHKSLYNLLYEKGSHNGTVANWVDDKNNNILHLVGMTSNVSTAKPHTPSRACLQMQQELLWFKEVEKLVLPPYINSKNDDGKTPSELFSETYKELASEGLKWTKDCMVVATLIITVTFAIALTIPGGYNLETGIPIFDHDTCFLVFIIADAFSLITSTTSLLVFLSILTSPHGQHGFLYTMPEKLMIGLATLYMSVAAMMVTFAASFVVIYQNTFKWLHILISLFAATPIIIYAALQYPFVMDMFRMYDSRYPFNTGSHVLYDKNNRQ